jgi:hypothetical protein
MVHVIIRASSTLVLGADHTIPRKPYIELAHVGPNGLSHHFSKDNNSYRYDTLQISQKGETTGEKWNIKLEYLGDANDTVDIISWANNKTLAGFRLEEGADEHIAEARAHAGIKISTTTTRDTLFNVVSSTCKLNNGTEDVCFW